MRLERFGTVTLPRYNRAYGLPTDESQLANLTLPGGGTFDGFGAADAPGLPGVITMTAVAAEDTLAALQTTVDGVRALNGVLDKLYVRMGDNTVRWRWARCSVVDSPRTRGPLRRDLSLSFALEAAAWCTHHYGAGWVLDGTHSLDTGYVLDELGLYTLDVSPKSIIIDVPGNAPVKDAIITVAVPVAGTPITALTIAITGVSSFTYASTIAAGKAVVFDCGGPTVRYDGTDDYADFTRPTTQVEWLVLEPGVNTVVVTKTGGGATSTITFDFWCKYR